MWSHWPAMSFGPKYPTLKLYNMCVDTPKKNKEKS